MDMTAALLIIVISPIYADNRGRAYLRSSEGKGIAVEREGVVEGKTADGRQVEHVVVMRECEYAHLHVIGRLWAIFLHIIKSIAALHIISHMPPPKSVTYFAFLISYTHHGGIVFDVDGYCLLLWFLMGMLKYIWSFPNNNISMQEEKKREVLPEHPAGSDLLSL